MLRLAQRIRWVCSAMNNYVCTQHPESSPGTVTSAQFIVDAEEKTKHIMPSDLVETCNKANTTQEGGFIELRDG